VGENVGLGERIGLMRFSSRMDVWLPKEAELLVKPGENVKGGISVLARWPGKTVIGKLDGKTAAETDENLTTTGERS
jgi:phosphatidylserine decarboxylase